jgi:hypothetical protein
MEESLIVGEPIGNLFGFFAGETPSSFVPSRRCAKEADHRLTQALMCIREIRKGVEDSGA